MSETSRAWLRHAVRWWYAAMTEIDKQGGVFSMQRTLESALKGLREAVTRWAANIRSHYIARKYTKFVGVVPKKEREKYRSLVKVTESGTYTLTAPFSTAIAQTEADTRAAQQRAQQNRKPGQQQQRAQRPRQQ